MSFPKISINRMQKSGVTNQSEARFEYWDAEVIDFERYNTTSVNTNYVTVGNGRNSITVPNQTVSVTEKLKAFVKFDHGKEVTWHLSSDVDVRKGCFLRGFFVKVDDEEHWVGCENLNTGDVLLEWNPMAKLLDGTKKQKLINGDNMRVAVNGKGFAFFLAFVFMFFVLAIGAAVVGGIVGGLGAGFVHSNLLAFWPGIHTYTDEEYYALVHWLPLILGIGSGTFFFLWAYRRFARRTFALRKYGPDIRSKLWECVNQVRKDMPLEKVKATFVKSSEDDADKAAD